jgi:hypothetical protein
MAHQRVAELALRAIGLEVVRLDRLVDVDVEAALAQDLVDLGDVQRRRVDLARLQGVQAGLRVGEVPDLEVRRARPLAVPVVRVAVVDGDLAVAVLAQHVRAGADGFVVEVRVVPRRRAGLHARPRGELVRQRRVGPVEVEAHVVLVDHLDRVDAGQVRVHTAALDGGGALEVGLHDLGVERGAVGERDALAQRHVEREVVDELPLRRQARLGLGVGGLVDQALVDRRQVVLVVAVARPVRVEAAGEVGGAVAEGGVVVAGRHGAGVARVRGRGVGGGGLRRRGVRAGVGRRGRCRVAAGVVIVVVATACGDDDGQAECCGSPAGRARTRSNGHQQPFGRDGGTSSPRTSPANVEAT